MDGSLMAASCRSCGAAVLWGVTGTGKRMPLNAEPSPDGNCIIDANGRIYVYAADTIIGAVGDLAGPRYLSHFATCHDGDKWRRPAK